MRSRHYSSLCINQKKKSALLFYMILCFVEPKTRFNARQSLRPNLPRPKNLTLIEGLKFYRKLLFADFLSIYKWENFESLSNESLYMLFTTPVILIRLAKTGVVCLGFHDMHVRPQNENLMEKNWKRFLNSWPDIKRKLFHSLRVIFKHIQWLIL